MSQPHFYRLRRKPSGKAADWKRTGDVRKDSLSLVPNVSNSNVLRGNIIRTHLAIREFLSSNRLC
jgi:hypothetical protein